MGTQPLMLTLSRNCFSVGEGARSSFRIISSTALISAAVGTFFQQYIEKHPPALGSNEGLMKWMCKAHNEVNERNNKDIFPCKMDDLITRWGACGCDEDESVTISKILERRRRSRKQKNNIY